MAIRAKLSPPREEQSLWLWHKAKCLAIPASSLWSGERRMEAENYLSGGYGIRLALQAKLGPEQCLGQLASVWQPSRLKGITVSEDFGTPFLAATQVFDLKPVARKFLSLDRTSTSADRFIHSGTIVLTCSGSVGRATLGTDALKGMLISHDLLRIAPIEAKNQGWVYAYLRSRIVREMMTSAQYGHIIKHLEPGHLKSLPIPAPHAELAEEFQMTTETILDDRNRAFKNLLLAESLFEKGIGVLSQTRESNIAFSVPASNLMTGRRRFEGVFHSPQVRSLYKHFSQKGLKTETLKNIGLKSWLPGRFPRIPAEEGVTLMGSADLFEMNPDLPKRIADIDFGDSYNGRVKQGWLLLARSGQTYGLNGTLVMSNKFHEEKVISDDAIRIAPSDKCTARIGYLYMALSHPTLGRPIVKSKAYGSSIPHIDVEDVNGIVIPRLSESEENVIADLAESSAKLFADADIKENEMSEKMNKYLGSLLGMSVS